jgi:hypothetical protein
MVCVCMRACARACVRVWGAWEQRALASHIICASIQDNQTTQHTRGKIYTSEYKWAPQQNVGSNTGMWVIPLSSRKAAHCSLQRHMGERLTGPHIVNVGTTQGATAQFQAQIIYQREITSRYPLAKSLGGPQSRSIQFGEEINLIHLPAIESRFLGHLSRSPSHCTDCVRKVEFVRTCDPNQVNWNIWRWAAKLNKNIET